MALCSGGPWAAASRPALRGNGQRPRTPEQTGSGLAESGRRGPGGGRACPASAAAGVRSITLVKLTTSLAAVRPMIAGQDGDPGPAAAGAAAAPRRAARPGRWPRRRPAWPAHPDPPGAAPAPRPSGAATARPLRPRQRTHGLAGRDAGRAGRTPSGTPAARATLMARPGRRSNRLSRFALPATRPALIDDVSGRAPGQPPAAGPGRADSADLHRPGGDLAAGQGAEVPAEPAPVAASGQIVIPAERGGPGPGGRQRGPAPGRQARGQPRRRDAAAAAAAGPSSRVTGSPRWLVRAHRPHRRAACGCSAAYGGPRGSRRDDRRAGRGHSAPGRWPSLLSLRGGGGLGAGGRRGHSGRAPGWGQPSSRPTGYRSCPACARSAAGGAPGRRRSGRWPGPRCPRWTPVGGPAGPHGRDGAALAGRAGRPGHDGGLAARANSCASETIAWLAGSELPAAGALAGVDDDGERRALGGLAGDRDGLAGEYARQDRLGGLAARPHRLPDAPDPLDGRPDDTSALARTCAAAAAGSRRPGSGPAGRPAA